MKPSDYIPNEPERKALHEFICATVAACVASIYPRADSRSFRRIIDNAVRGAEAAPRVEEACSACREAAAERSRHCVACRDGRIAAAEAGLFRTLSFARAELSPDDIRRAEADGRDHLKDPGPYPEITRDVIADEKSIQSKLTDARIAAFRDSDEERQAVRAAVAERYHETDTDAGPASLG